MLIIPDEVVTGALVNAIAVVGRQIGKTAAGLRKPDESLVTARWFETFRLTRIPPSLPELSPASSERLARAFGGAEIQASLQELLAARLTDASETDASRARVAVSTALSAADPEAAAFAAALAEYYDDQICALVASLEAEEPPLLAQIRSEAFSSRIISTLRTIERHVAGLADDDRGRDGRVAAGRPGAPAEGARWRVFVSHTSELREFPAGGSYVAAVERAISACGHVIVDMADFPAADQPSAELCADRVRSCQVYVGVLGTRYGSPVRDRREVSYTELEFDTATAAGLKRLVFVLDTAAADVGIPVDRLMDLEFGARQQGFRRRVQDSGLVTQSFTNPATLGQLVERSLRELAEISFGGEKDPGKDPLRDVEISNPKLKGLVLRVSTTSQGGESQNIEFFDAAIAQHWIMNYLQGRMDPPEHR